MAFPEGESLESWLSTILFSNCVCSPQIAVRLLVHKIHSQEWEALQALTYMGDSVSDKVKNKIIEMLYSWTVVFPNEAKIADAYQTLKRQGLVKSDPELTVDKSLIPSPPTRPKNPVFDNEDMGKLLAELLRSKNPEDLQEANRLIKNMVKEDEARVQKIAKRNNTLEEVNNNVKLLSEMLSHYDRDRSSDADRELIKELYERCDKLRRTAFKLATEAEDNDSSLGDILKANDDLSRVISSYKRIVEGQADDGEGEDLRQAASEGCETTGTLIDLAGLDEPSSPPTVAPPPPLPPQVPSANPTASPIPVLPPPPRRLAGGHGSQTSSPSHKPPEQQTSLSLLDDELLSLGLNDPPSVPNRLKLDELSGQWTSLQLLSCKHSEVFLLVSSGKVLPVTVYDKDGVRVLMHFAMDCPPGRPDVLVMVVSLLNTAPLPVRNIVLQAAVPKSMGVKLQPPSGTEIAPFNPILPPASITQVMLLANPLKERVRLRYKLAYLLGERQYSEVRELDQFPPADRWGSL
uniref:Golgi associated, gamma adaptin ear containing, ARF binding protein 3b n=1 Tax=Cyprinus carpio TaxID=7962 RepID=A0A8C1XAM7_CYPCA